MSGIDMTDILGIGSTPPKQPETMAQIQATDRLRRPLVKPKVTVAQIDADPTLPPVGKNGTPHASMFLKPVGVTFLAAVVGKQPKQIEKRLAKCPVAEWRPHGGKDQPMYKFLEAMAYLIPPKGNIEDWFAQQNAASLPPYVNKMWWDSANQRNRVMMASGDLWHTEDVMVLAGRVAMTIRESVKMWIEELPDKDLLTDAQHTALQKYKDKLLSDLQTMLVTMPRQTLSMSAHIQAELNANTSIPDDADRADDEEA